MAWPFKGSSVAPSDPPPATGCPGTPRAELIMTFRFRWISALLNGRRHPIKRRPTLGAAPQPGWQEQKAVEEA
jgi:hypothetical protein